jgi:nitrite reductase (NADH) small subunit/3-phenylpropionate/trans-cinnamate dioxygenase ferredoxin subunit
MPRIPLCSISDLPEGASCSVTLAGQPVAVFHVGGALYAIEDRCPHAGAPLSGGHVEAGVVTCPRHAWRFRLSDGAWADNPKVCIKTYSVALDGTQVVLDLLEPTSN